MTDVEVWLAPPEAAAALDPDRLDETGRRTWSSLRSARRRADWASSRALLQSVGERAECSCSLAHSRGYSAVAIAPESSRVGVDLEFARSRDFDSLAAAAYSTGEAEFIASLTDADRKRSEFYVLWTLKEAFAKALGLALADALTQCTFVDDDGRRRAIVPTDEPWRAIAFRPRVDVFLTLACIDTQETRSQAAPLAREWPDGLPGRWSVQVELYSGWRGSAGRPLRAAGGART